MRRRAVWMGVAALALLACRGPSTAPPRAVADPGLVAAAALERGDYAQAVALYRQAVRQQPDRLPLHYGLAVAASHLNLKDEAVREFSWVLEWGPAGSTEVERARRWLTSAGVLQRPVAVVATALDDQAPGNASMEGRAVFAEGNQPPQPVSRMQLFLVGQPDSPTQRERYNLRTDEDGRFKFPSVVPGPYKLTNRVAGQPIWRLRVELKPGETTLLELTPANSVAARDDFPERR